MATTTTNLKLTKPAASEAVNIATINNNMDLIDSKVLLKSGGTATGNIYVQATSYPGLGLKNANGDTIGAMLTYNTDTANRLAFRQRHPATPDHYEGYSLPYVTENMDADAGYVILTSKSAVTVAQGGTGATTAQNARYNLDLQTDWQQTTADRYITTGTIINNQATLFLSRANASSGTIGAILIMDLWSNRVIVLGSLPSTIKIFKNTGNTSSFEIRNNSGVSVLIRSYGAKLTNLSTEQTITTEATLICKDQVYPGETYSESTTILTGGIRNSAKSIVLRVEMSRSLASINNISVTSFTGWITSTSGIIAGSGDSTNWLTMSGVTARASKKSDSAVLIIFDCSSALSNAVNGIAQAYCSFTLSFS